MNRNRLRDLREEVGEDAFGEVLDLFLAETDEKIDELAAGRPLADLGADMHFLKGAALNLGLDDLAASCQTAEAMAAAGDAASIDVPAILALYARSRALLVAERDSVGA